MNEFNDFSIQDEYDVFMQDAEEEHTQQQPILVNPGYFREEKAESSSGSIFNMEEEF